MIGDEIDDRIERKRKGRRKVESARLSLAGNSETQARLRKAEKKKVSRKATPLLVIHTAPRC